MNARSFILITSLLLVSFTFAQDAVVKQGKPFIKTQKGSTGADVHFVVNGIAGTDGRAVLFVEEGLAHKLVRLDMNLQPSEEVTLQQLTFDGKKWDGIASIVSGNEMHVLFASNGKKAAELGIANVELSGPLAISGFHSVAPANARSATRFKRASRRIPSFAITPPSTRPLGLSTKPDSAGNFASPKASLSMPASFR